MTGKFLITLIWLILVSVPTHAWPLVCNDPPENSAMCDGRSFHKCCNLIGSARGCVPYSPGCPANFSTLQCCVIATSHGVEIPTPAEWTCYFGECAGGETCTMAVSLSENGDVQCLSSNGFDCDVTCCKGGDISNCNLNNNVYLLECGAMHAVLNNGTTGYLVDHWCNSACIELFQGAPDENSCNPYSTNNTPTISNVSDYATGLNSSHVGDNTITPSDDDDDEECKIKKRFWNYDYDTTPPEVVSACKALWHPGSVPKRVDSGVGGMIKCRKYSYEVGNGEWESPRPAVCELIEAAALSAFNLALTPGCALWFWCLSNPADGWIVESQQFFVL